MSDSSGVSREFVETVSGIFECLGRALICLDGGFRVVHASASLDGLVGAGTAESIVGRPVEESLGHDLFGADGSLRRLLEAGQRREGWGASFTAGSSRSRMMSISAAPITSLDSTLCDPSVAYLLVLRAADDSSESETSMPTMFSGMLARSSAMLQIFRLIRNLAESDATVLLTGESGTGKEVVGRALHANSLRRSGPFVVVNCAALPGELLDSELFGHVRGAFTGAIRDRDGRFELAHGGTLFLDEIGDIPLPLQVKLLRVLQDRTFERVGENRSRKTDARIIAATNRNLQRAILEGSFREDLYYRLRVVPIHLPPLRERREDVEPLARHLLTRVCARHDRSMRLGPDALRVALGYPWPGNIRELENALEYAVAVCRGQTIHAADLPLELQPAATIETPPPVDERERLRQALDAHRWSRAATARALGISRSTLWRRMRELGLDD